MTPEDQLRQERGRDYGPVRENHIAIGMIWGGILLQGFMAGRWIPGEPVPPELVTLMMAGVKASREAFKHKADNVLDARNYLAFTGELAEGK